ncbi:hypothetical protein DIPPA_03592 [Diplonema papillatum]|nr:hypothetical protein DIPPA_03592 [Diplonema papillatum]
MPAGRAPASRPSSASDVAAVSQREDSSEPTAAAAVAAPPRPFGAQTPPNGAQAQGPPAAAAAAAAAAGAREAEPVEGSQPFFSAFQLPRAGRAPASRQSSASHATAAPQREPSSEPAANSRGSGAAAAAVVAPAARMPSGTNGQRSPSNNSAAAPSAGASRHSATRGPAANRNGAAAVVAPPAPAPRSRGPPAAAAAARTNDGHPDPSNSPAAAPPGASLRPSADAAGGSSQQNSGGRPPPPQAGTAAPTPQGTPAEYLDADEDEESLGFGSDGTSEEVIAVQRPAGMPATRLEDMLSTPVAVGVGGSQAGKRKRAEESSPATGKQAKLDPPPGGVRAALQVRDEGDLVSRLSRLVFPVNGQPAITHASLHPDQPLKPAVLDTPRRWPVGLAPRLHATQVTLVGKLKRTHWALLSVGRKRGVREFNDAADQLVAVDLRRLHASAAFAHLSASCAIPCTPVDGCSAGVELPQDGDDPFDETRLAALEQFASSPLVHENGFRVRWGEDGLLRITHMHDGGVVPGYGLRDLWHVAGKLAALRMSGGAAGILADFRSPAAEAAFRERAAREAEQLYPGGDADAAAESAQQTLKLALEAGLDFDEPSGLTLCEFS